MCHTTTLLNKCAPKRTAVARAQHWKPANAIHSFKLRRLNYFSEFWIFPIVCHSTRPCIFVEGSNFSAGTNTGGYCNLDDPPKQGGNTFPLHPPRDSATSRSNKANTKARSWNMTVKRRNHGRNRPPGARGHVKFVRCDSTSKAISKDKAVKRFMVRTSMLASGTLSDSCRQKP